MDQEMKEKIATAAVAEIDKALQSGSIPEETAEDAGADFYELLESYKDEKTFFDDFVLYLRRYPFMENIGDYYGAVTKQSKADNEIDKIRSELSSLSSN